ncbi:MAG: B-box zinc finger protein [Candidatus Promineifilaceae bacterium]|nr:B-box zinc finger protein [Candidatus Promineifilaceae bacterium]
MTVDAPTPRIRSLLRQAARAADAGKRTAARQLYQQIIEEAPETPAAWIGLARVTDDPHLSEAHLRRARTLDPSTASSAETEDVVLDKDPAPEATEPRDWHYERKLEKEDETAPDEAESSPVDGNAAEPEAQASPGPTVRTTRVGDQVRHDVIAENETLFCANHPGRTTGLRCNRCGKPICSSCARPTPVGYRCPQCIREQEDVYFTARPVDYLIALIIATPLAFLSGFLALRLGFFVIFLSAIAGTLIGRIAFRAVGRRRGRWLPHLVAGIVCAGGVLPGLAVLLGGGGLFGLIWIGLYVVIATGSAYWQLK